MRSTLLMAGPARTFESAQFTTLLRRLSNLSQLESLLLLSVPSHKYKKGFQLRMNNLYRHCVSSFKASSRAITHQKLPRCMTWTLHHPRVALLSLHSLKPRGLIPLNLQAAKILLMPLVTAQKHSLLTNEIARLATARERQWSPGTAQSSGGGSFCV